MEADEEAGERAGVRAPEEEADPAAHEVGEEHAPQPPVEGLGRGLRWGQKGKRSCACA